MGYRWYDKKHVAPAFPFGHGLSYGSFAYSDLVVVGREISFTMTRSSGACCDTAQLYLSYPTAGSDPAVPAKVLRHFQKVCLASAKVAFLVADADVSIWKNGAWVVVRGMFDISVGSSSANILLAGNLLV